MLKLICGNGWNPGKDTLRSLTTGSSLAVQFSSLEALPTVIDISACKVPLTSVTRT